MTTASLSPAIVWFRDDLRLADNPALDAAARSGRELICVYIYDEASAGVRPLGGAARWWLHGALAALDEALTEMGGRLIILRGPAAAIIDTLAAAVGAGAIYWNRRYDAAGRAVDTAAKVALKQRGIAAESFNGLLLHEPWTVMNREGAPFRVFTAYWRAARSLAEPARPLAAPQRLAFAALPGRLGAGSVALADLALEPGAPDWASDLRARWERSEAAARQRLDAFLATGLRSYASDRDRPDRAGTSRLSPYLRFGQLSPRQVWHAAAAASMAAGASAGELQLEKFLAELGWREFSYHLLYHWSDLARRNFRSEFDAMAWRTDHGGLRAWQRGRTGYPFVDAGMRELWATGWMHNRARMVAASFLVKHLLVDWRDGEVWFWDTLVDADPANNAASWQWVAGSGADAAPYFRVFNPVLQGEKFDPDGAYVARFVPELARLPASLIHKPWRASADQLAAAGLCLGADYPRPIIEHDEARRRALGAWRALKAGDSDA